MSWLDDAWLELRHGGLLLDATTLEGLPEPPALRGQAADRLRMAWVGLDSDEPTKGDAFGVLLDEVLEHTCGLSFGWSKGSAVGAAETERLLDGTELKPRRIWSGVRDERLLLFTTPAEELGRGRGRRPCAQVVEYLRRRGQPLGLLTNGREWRLYWADRDNQAWVEWAADRWFEGDQLAPTAQLLRRVLSPRTLARDEKAELSPLLAAIRETRRGQAKLSKDLGERVRRAVETFLRARRPILEPAWGQHRSTDLYGAACHLVMRVVVILFAEARELLPVDSPIYHHGYGLRGLLDQLDRLGPERRRARHAAWPRLLALFRLLHDGSPHPAVAVPAYGGDLFAPGNNATGDGHLRALHLLEDGAHPPDDETVYQLLVYLTRTKQRVRDGAGWRTVAAPVDFTELTSEYVGILYEGLLDYELKRADAEPMIFLNLGDQPALPLNRLEDMDDKALAALVEKAKVKRAAVVSEDGDEEDETGEEADAEETEGEESEDADDGGEAPAEEPGFEGDAGITGGDERVATRTRALAWAERAALAGKLVKKPKGKNGVNDPAYQATLQAAAKSLVADIKLPGELYLVRWGGTRKGAGTFYTRPQITLPTVRRTLEPLVLDPEGKPRTPEDILGLKVCDPAMGSGSFLIAALRVLTRAVIEALHHHARVTREGDRLRLACNLLPQDDRVLSEDQLEARVRRVVVEHCLYGVDIDPLAVRLAQVALWIETLDRRLPFTFLDHKLRCGDSLLGTWLDRFRDYPLLAWARQSPDEKWSGVHHPAKRWHSALKARLKAVAAEQTELLKGQTSLAFASVSDEDLRQAVDRVRRLYRELRNVPAQQPDKRARLWRERIQHDPALDRVRAAFDLWCALWFWPPDRACVAPGPRDLHQPPPDAQRIAQDVARARHFFHWELEFPDVFVSAGSGFDAIVGNPPWEIRKPNSREFFSNHDPLYRAYGKQEALQRQKEIFEADAGIEEDWLGYQGFFKDAGNFVRHVAEPFGDGKVEDHGGGEVSLAHSAAGVTLHKKWRGQRSRRTGCADPEHPFRHQGSADLNTYKLFLEQSHALLRKGGLLGLVVPSGLYSDKGSGSLRKLFLDHCGWRWLYSFENRDRIFDIHRSFKFCIAILEKGGSTASIRTSFMRSQIEDWQAGVAVLEYPLSDVTRFSPFSKSLLEFRSVDHQALTSRQIAASIFVGNLPTHGVEVTHGAGLHMTSKSAFFPPVSRWRELGYQPMASGLYRGPEGEIATPLLQGAMVWQFESWFQDRKSNLERASAAPLLDGCFPEPTYLIHPRDGRNESPIEVSVRLGFRDVQNATNQRTFVGTLLPPFSAGNTVNYVSVGSLEGDAFLLAALSSFATDYLLRNKMTQNHVNWFYVEELPLPEAVLDQGMRARVSALVLRLTSIGRIGAIGSIASGREPLPPSHWAVSTHERIRVRCMLDAIISVLYGFNRADLTWILKDCDHPTSHLSSKSFCRRLDPKGFWRVDKMQDPELRHTVLTIAAYDDLHAEIARTGDRDAGIRAFCEANNGDGWLIPETLLVRNLGMNRSFDVNTQEERAADTPRPVRSRLGPRKLEWQTPDNQRVFRLECERETQDLLDSTSVLATSLPSSKRKKRNQGSPGPAGPRD